LADKSSDFSSEDRLRESMSVVRQSSRNTASSGHSRRRGLVAELFGDFIYFNDSPYNDQCQYGVRCVRHREELA